MYRHWLAVINVEMGGYSIGFFTVLWKYNQTLLFLVCPDLTRSTKVVIVWRRIFVCSRDDPSGDILTPRIF